MLYQNLSKYGLATHLALAAALPAALAQFVPVETLSYSMFWVSALAVIWMLIEPSVLSGETISAARARVVSRTMRDPMSWFLLLVVIFAFARWLNDGVKLAFDAESATWAVKEPGVSILPASTGSAGLFPLALAVSMSIVIVGVKQTLGKQARIWFGVAVGAFAAIGACIAAVNVGLGVEPFRSSALSGFGAPCFYGSQYALFLPMAVACGIQAEQNGMTKARLPFAWAVAGNSVGAYLFLPGILCVAYLVISVIVAIIAFALSKRCSGAAATARAASMLAFGVIIAIFSVILPSFADVQKSKSDGFDLEKSFSPALYDRNEALFRVSKAIWLESPWSGSGVGSFVLQAPFFVSKEDWSVLPPQPEVGPNGFMTLIAERGIVGAIFWAVGVGFLLYFWVSRLIGSFAWHRQQDEGRSWFVNIPAVVWVGPLVFLAAIADAFFSSGFPLTALAVCVAVSLSLSAASFPKVKRSSVSENSKG